MCGICGITWSDPELIARMAELLRHRGPEQHGSFCDDQVSLGHRRLRIIDLSRHGIQPMANEDATVQVVFNGEIYNFRDLRKQLEAKGHRFRSATDTEVIVHGYEEWGEDCLDRFNGMFAFAIWDTRERKLFIARDRIGIKPLYYAVVDRGSASPNLMFASELKALLAHPGLSRDVDPQAVYQYVGYEYIAAPRTILEQVSKLPPAHCMSWRPGEAPSVRRYWQLSMKSQHRPTEEYEELIRVKLEESVNRRLVSDVPIGVFLSGGVDSTALVAMMHRLEVDPLRTFSLHYEESTFSELPYSRFVAETFGTEHLEMLIEPTRPELLEESIWHLDEPMTDLSAVPFYLLSEKVREHVTVCLSGEGGDELFIGYDRYKASELDRVYSLLPGFVRRRVIAEIAARLSDRPDKKGPVNLLKRFVEGSVLPPDGEHLRWQYFLPPAYEGKLFSERVRPSIDFDPFAPIREVVRGIEFDDRIARESYVDITFFMASSLLYKVDKLSMAHALEVRVPFLDHELVELCGLIPSREKFRYLKTKVIFRAAMRGILPDRIRRRGKQGYSMPIKNWLRNELKAYFRETVVGSEFIREYFDLNFIETLMKEHDAARANHNHLLWALLNLAIWHRLFIAGEGLP